MGIIEALDQIKPDVPMVVRLVGTNEEEGRQILEASPYDLKSAKTLADAAKKAVAAAQRKDSVKEATQ
jgi:succinyl-CoA synthetase beta subunit